MTDPLNFTGKVTLVTGSSRGLGAEMIKAFGNRGAQCVVNYVFDAAGQNKSDAETVAQELKNPLVIECDVTNPEQVESMMKTIGDKFGGLDILINNSGIIRDRTIKKLTPEDFEKRRAGKLNRHVQCHAESRRHFAQRFPDRESVIR